MGDPVCEVGYASETLRIFGGIKKRIIGNGRGSFNPLPIRYLALHIVKQETLIVWKFIKSLC